MNDEEKKKKEEEKEREKEEEKRKKEEEKRQKEEEKKRKEEEKERKKEEEKQKKEEEKKKKEQEKKLLEMTKPKKMAIAQAKTPKKKKEPEPQKKRTVIEHKSNKPAQNIYEMLGQIEANIAELTRVYGDLPDSRHYGVGGQMKPTLKQEMVAEQIKQARARADRLLKLIERQE